MCKKLLCSSSIYLSDVDASHMKMKCSEGCSIYFHPECFPKMKIECSPKIKTQCFPKIKMKKTSACITPDCMGYVTSVEKH